MKLWRVRDYWISLCYLPHALATHYFLRLTRARGKSSQREGNALFDDFWYFSSLKSTIKEKFLYVSSRANNVRPYHAGRRGADPYKLKPKYSQQPKQKIYAYPLFLLHMQAQKKKLQKRKRREGIDTYAKHVCRRRRDGVISHSAERDRRHRRLVQAFKKA